jgi:type III restriction enzyme
VKLLLKDFQTAAVGKLARELRFASRESRGGSAQSICLSSPTGSGKTVMVTATIELILKGDGTAAPEPEASFLWITDLPELNEQTKRKMQQTSTFLTGDRLKIIDSSFDEEMFKPGVVHFLNIQKLGKDKVLITPGDERTYTIWETVSNTIIARPGRFFVIIDEAHRGMNETARARNEAATIIQKFIKGSPGEIPAVPLIFGVSATPERFVTLLEGAGITRRTVDVKPEDVRGSGLIKEVIILYHHADQEKATDMTMLRAAVGAWKMYGKKWEEYCVSQNEPVVRPILVVQVQDGTAKQLSKTDISEAIRVIHDEAGNLPNAAFAHSFQEGSPVAVGEGELRYIAPSDIQSDTDVRVVFFKSSLNTGWDCPRAEVMMSFRTAADSTFIAQLVGRMVRTPLARRIDADETLNTVALYLPHYDRAGLDRIIERLTKSDADTMPSVEIRLGEDVTAVPKAAASDAAFTAITALPSYTIPRPHKTSEIRRLMKLSRLLANDEIDENAPDKAAKKLLSVLNAQYGRLKRTKRFRELVEDRAKVEVRAVNFAVGIDLVSEGETIQLAVSAENLEDLFDAAGRRLGEGLHKAWWRHRVNEDASVKEKAKLELIALCFLEDDVLVEIEEQARKLVQDWLHAKKKPIKELTEARRQEYDEIRRLASEPEITTLAYPPEIDAKKGEKKWKKHLYANGGGLFPCKFNTWEAQVIGIEIARADVVGWLRNADRKAWSLTVPYQLAGEYKPLYPDFLVIRKERRNLVVDILDPHAIHLEDSPAKAAGLAHFAMKHAHEFGRIELIVVDGDNMKRLDLADQAIRDKVKAVKTHEHLRQLYDQA